MIKKLPSVTDLRRFLRYDHKTGFLYWKSRSESDFPSSKNPKNTASRWNSQFSGKQAFVNKHERGYMVGKINNVHYYAHRVIWKLVYGTEPEKIDHLSGDTSDNRLCNLRSVDDATNSRNVGVSKRNTSGMVGVYWDSHRSQWRSRISDGPKRIHLGNFDTFEEAAIARKVAERSLGFHPNHGRAAA